MEWILLLAYSVVFILVIKLLNKYGCTNGIYRKRTRHFVIDNRKMVSVSPVKLPYSVQIEQGRESGLLNLVIQGERKCTLTSYVCVNNKELQRVVVGKMCSPSRTLVDVLDLISVWVSEPTQVSFSNGSYKHQISIQALPRDVREQLHNLSADNFAPLVFHLKVSEEEQEMLIEDNNILSMLTVVVSSTNSSSFKHEAGPLHPSTGMNDVAVSSAPSWDINIKPIYMLSEQYIETIDRRVFALKPLYNSGVDRLDDTTLDAPVSSNSTSTDVPSSLSSEPKEEFCLICQEHPVSRALLPCRHVCSCQLCFGKLTLCPICRQPIVSYFLVRGEAELPEVATTVVGEDEDDLTSMIQNEGIWSFIKSIWNAS